MRIGFDLTAAVTQGGGIGRYTRELVHALLAVDSQNSYHFFSAKQPPQLPVPNSIPQAANATYREAPLDGRWLYRIWHRLRLPIPVQLLTGSIDLFHSPDFVLPPVAGNIPTLLTVHDLSFIHYPETFPPALVRYLNTVVPRSVARATHILADSQATKDDLVGQWRVPPEKVTVLYSGVNPRFQPVVDGAQQTAVRHKYQLGDAPYLLSVGTIQPRKNYQMLIQSFRPVAERFPHNLYISGGKGWLYDDMLAEIARQGLQDRVRFIGFVDDADLPTLYSAADLFLFPSVYEGFGLPLLEAMACGVPVISSDASSLPEVGAGVARLIAPHPAQLWTEAMAQLLADEPQRQHMRQAGLQHVHRFSWQKTAVHLRQIYQLYAK